MSVPAPVQAEPASDTIGGQVRLLDDTWVLTLLAVLIAAAVPRLLSVFEIDFGAVICGVLGLGAVHVALAAAAEGAWPVRTLSVIHAAGIVLIGIVWQYAGALQNPLFLLTFVLPVISAGLISRRQPYPMAALAILIATAVALRQTPELRWYAAGINGAGAWLAALFGGAQSSTLAPLAGFYAPAGYFVVTLAVFAILLCACAVSSEFLTLLITRLRKHAAAADREANLAQDHWIQLIQSLPVPAVLVEVETLQVVCRSACWGASPCAEDEYLNEVPLQDLLASSPAAVVDAPPAGDLFGMVRFSYPEVVEELIAGEGGLVRPCMFRLAGQLRVAEIHVQPLLHAGRRLALVIMTDVTEAFCVQASLDASDYAALLVDSEGRVMGFNKAARGLFTDIKTGIEAFPLLAKADARKGWWDPGLRGRRKSHVKMDGRAYDVYSSTVAMPGEEHPLYVIGIVPAAKTSAFDAFVPVTSREAI